MYETRSIRNADILNCYGSACIHNLYEHTNAYYINPVSELVKITFFWRFSRRIGAKLFASFVFEVAVVWELFPSLLLIFFFFFPRSLENAVPSTYYADEWRLSRNFGKNENFIRDLHAIDLKVAYIPRRREFFFFFFCRNVQKTRFARNRIVPLRYTGNRIFFILKITLSVLGNLIFTRVYTVKIRWHG